MKTLWIVSGGIEAIPGILRAKELGLNVVVSDGNPSAPGFQYADHAVVVSTYDHEATLSMAKRFQDRFGPIHGILCIAADVPLTVSHVAEALGLPGIPRSAALHSTNKLTMKKCFASHRNPDSSFFLNQYITSN